MEPLVRDVRLALRRLRLSPAFTLFAVASLALGIGVSTAIYSAVRTLLWMPVGVPHAGELVVVHNPRILPSMSWLDFQEFRAQQTSAGAVAAGVLIRTAFQSAGVSQTVFGAAVSGQYFSVMEQRARLGRLLDIQDEAAGARVAVVSETFWRTRLAADPAIVGRAISLGGERFEVIGVVAGSFRGLEIVLPHSLWMPVTALPSNLRAFSLASNLLSERRIRDFEVWARLRPGRTIAQFSAEARTIAARIDAAYPPDGGGLRGFSREWQAEAYGFERRRGTEAVRTIVFSILVAIAMVLLIACTNLANLALARGTARAQETAVRRALGATRWRLIREQLVETGLVVAAGIGLAWVVLLRLVDYFAIDLPVGRGATIPFRPQIDGSVQAAACLAAVLALAVFGLWPAVQSAGADVRRGLGAGGAATTPKWRLHRGLIAWQVCGSAALLLVAVMSVRIIRDPMQSTMTPRFRDLALAQIDFALTGADESRARQAIDAIMDRLRATPGLAGVSATNGAPSSFEGTRRFVTRPEVPFTAAGNSGRMVAVSAVAPGFLATLDVPIVRGRALGEHDDAAAARVGVVTEQLARDVFQTTDVVGKTLLVASSARLPSGAPAAGAVTIVGVARDVQMSPTALQPDRLLFVPLAQAYDHRAPVLFVARSTDPSAAVATLRDEIRRVDPSLALSAAGTGAVLLEGPFFLLRVIAAMAAALGSLGLVLAMAGLFGILTHVVDRRTREIGIRLAVGADRGQILRLVLRDGLHPVARGLVLGLAIGLGSRIVLRGQIFTTIAAWDPMEFAVLPLLFLGAACIACAVPAARASRVDPNVALRDL
jgi:predicted permease